MLWYAQMVADEETDRYEYNLNLAEYLASFWNSEAVQNIRNQRDVEGDERFASDEEFSKQMLDREFVKTDELVQAIRDKYKNTNLDGNNRDEDRGARNTRAPKDMSRLFKMTGDKIK